MDVTAAPSLKKKSKVILCTARAELETQCAGALLKYNHHSIDEHDAAI